MDEHEGAGWLRMLYRSCKLAAGQRQLHTSSTSVCWASSSLQSPAAAAAHLCCHARERLLHIAAIQCRGLQEQQALALGCREQHSRQM